MSSAANSAPEQLPSPHPADTPTQPLAAGRILLTSVAHQELQAIMSGQGAEHVFSQFGERGYLAYVQGRLRESASPQLVSLVTKPTEPPVPKTPVAKAAPAPPPAPVPRLAAPTAPPRMPQIAPRRVQTVPAVAAPNAAPRLGTNGSALAHPPTPAPVRVPQPAPDASPRVATAVAVAPQPPTPVQPLPAQDTAAKRQLLDTAGDRYAMLTAQQRASHGNALLTEAQGRNYRLGTALWLGSLALNPLSFADYRSARELADQTTAARASYIQALRDYVGTLTNPRLEQLQWQQDEMTRFETRVREYMTRQTQSGVDAQNRPTDTRIDRFRQNIARWWENGRTARRVAIVALPAAGVGLGVGLLTAPVSGPALAVAVLAGGYASLVGGRMVGDSIAQTVNRYRVTAPKALQEMQIQAGQRNGQLIRNFTVTRHNPRDIDLTVAYTEGTRQASLANLERKRRAEAVGSIAATVAFALSELGLIAAKAAATPAHPGPPATSEQTPPTSTPSPTPPTPNTLPPGINPAAYPWTVARQLNPGDPMGFIQHAMTQYNAQFGTHLQFVSHTNGTVWVENGLTPLDPAHQAAFNQFMMDHFLAGA